MTTVDGVIRGPIGGSVRRRKTRRNRLVVVLLAILGCLVLVLGGEAWALAAPGGGSTPAPQPSYQAAAPIPTVSSSTTTSSTTSTSSTSTTLPALPMAEADLAQAASAWAKQLAADPSLTTCQLTIPSIGLDLPILEMTEDSLLDIGPGHWPETPLPGQNGDFVLSGHRSTHGSPFLRLGELKPGDVIVVTLPYAEVTYEVTRTLIVGWEDVDVVQSRGLEELSMTTCNPIGRADNVMVVQAEAVECRPTETDL